MSACNNSMTYFATTDRSHDFNKSLPSRLILSDARKIVDGKPIY